MKNRFLSIVMSFIIALSIIGSASVYADENMEKNMTLEEARNIAYIDIKSTDEVTLQDIKEQVLEARKIVANTKSWVADGYSGCIINTKTGEKKELPTFSSVFPDWDLPSSSDNIELENKENSLMSRHDTIYKIKYTELNHPTNVNTYSFAYFLVDKGDSVLTRALELYTSETYNVGYSINGQSIGHGTYLGLYDAFAMDGLSGEHISVRASTYDSEGAALFQMEDYTN